MKNSKIHKRPNLFKPVHGLILVSVFSVLIPFRTQAHSEGGISKKARAVCEGKEKSASCEYKNHNGDLYRGSCQKAIDALLCVRNKPIIKSGESNQGCR